MSETHYFVNRDHSYGAFEKLAAMPQSKYAVMMVHAGEKMGKTWLLNRMEDHARDTLGLPVTRVDFRHPRDRTRITDFLGLIRLLRDRFDQPAVFGSLNATIRKFTDRKPQGSGRFIIQLSQKLEKHGSLSVIKQLATFIGERDENIGGENTLRSKAFELVTLAFEGQLMDALFEGLELLLADANVADGYWREGYAALFPSFALGVRDTVVDNGEPIRFTSQLEFDNAKRQINAAFFAALGVIAQQKGQALIIIDAWESVPDEIARWVDEELYPRIHDPARRIEKLFVVMAGRHLPDLSIRPIAPFVAPDLAEHTRSVYPLSPFSGDYFRYLVEYMEQRRKLQETAAVTWRAVETFSQGVPGEIAKFADILEQQQAVTRAAETPTLNGVDDPFFAEPVGVGD